MEKEFVSYSTECLY